MTSVSTVVATAPVDLRGPGRAWIQSRFFDLTFFILSPVLSLLVVFGARLSPLVAVATTMFLGFPHYYSTFTFYFWNEYRERHTARWLTFFGGPVLIVAATTVLIGMKLIFLYSAIIYFWTAVHVSRQNTGILSIYRHRSGRPRQSDKRIANGAILSTNLWFTVWNLQNYPLLHQPLARLWRDIPKVLWISVGTCSVVMLSLLTASLWKRWQQDSDRPTAAEIAFIVISIAMFHPYLWVRDPALATLAMLAGHFVQYLGIVWLLHRRKYSRESTAAVWRPIVVLSTNVPVLIGTLGFLGLITLSIYVGALRLSQARMFEIGSLSIVFIHYYLDGLFWAFRDPVVRKTLSPYLVAPTWT